MIRRAFLLCAATLVTAPRRVWAQLTGTAGEPRFQALNAVVRVPADQVTEPWRAVPFTAAAVERSAAAPAGRRVLISGIVFRHPAPEGTALSALCVTCPHEQCEVQLVTGGERLARIAGDGAPRPMLQCGCHFSVFDPLEQGARVSGPTPRGLFRFTVRTAGDVVEIDRIEEDALSAV